MAAVTICSDRLGVGYSQIHTAVYEINKLLELINEFSKLTDKRSTHKIQLHFYTLAVNNLKAYFLI